MKREEGRIKESGLTHCAWKPTRPSWPCPSRPRSPCGCPSACRIPRPPAGRTFVVVVEVIHDIVDVVVVIGVKNDVVEMTLR